jgi:hypothetical protein
MLDIGDERLENIVIHLTISTFIWSCLQVIFFQWPNLEAFKTMNKRTYLDFRNRQVSFVHGSICLCLSSYITAAD